MNKMIEFATTNRTTTFFRDYAITEIRVAYRIMEYLQPDGFYKSEINSTTLELILRDEFELAYGNIVDEINIELPNSSWACEALRKNAVECMEHLKPTYVQQVQDEKTKRKIELLNELKTLDN